MFGQGYQKLFFCDIQAMVFLQSYVIMSGGHLWETENKKNDFMLNFWLNKWSQLLRKSWLPRTEFLK